MIRANEYIVGTWYDAEALNGRGIPGEYAAEIDPILGPNNKRDLPCNGCEAASSCRKNGTECEAFRTWCNKGDYLDETVGIKLKVI